MIGNFGHIKPREAVDLLTRALREVDIVQPLEVRGMVTFLLRAERERIEILERRRGNFAGALWGEPINGTLGLATAIVDAAGHGGADAGG
ncbi:MAG: hypothetical protein HOY78_02440 [Saccharothrix sp.]|nr:hypothetical protein [Saccharothrix sp.]